MHQITLEYFNHASNATPHQIIRNMVHYYDLTIVLKGTLHYVYNDTEVTLHPGSFILFRPGDYRERLEVTDPSDYYSFNFMTDIDLQSVLPVTHDALDSEVNLLLTVCDQLQNKSGKDSEKTAHILAALLLYLQENNANNVHMKPLALKIKNYILDHFAERITLQGIAEEFHFSASYCNNVFKKETKKSIVDFLINERIQKAKELLLHTDYPLPLIASKVGYDDYNYFSRLFKKHTMYTPMKYRNLYSKKR